MVSSCLLPVIHLLHPTQLRAAGGSWDIEYLHYKHHFGEKAKGEEEQPATPQTMQHTENDKNLR